MPYAQIGGLGGHRAISLHASCAVVGVIRAAAFLPVGDLRPDHCSCRVASANCGQIVGSLALFCIFDERDTLCNILGGAVSWHLSGIGGFTT